MQRRYYAKHRLSDAAAWKKSCTCALRGICERCYFWSSLIAAAAWQKARRSAEEAARVYR